MDILVTFEKDFSLDGCILANVREMKVIARGHILCVYLDPCDRKLYDIQFKHVAKITPFGD